MSPNILFRLYPGHFAKPIIPKLAHHTSSSLPSCWTPPRGWTLRPKRSACPCVVLVCSVLTLGTLILNTTSLRMASSFQFGVRVFFGLSLNFYKQMYCDLINLVIILMIARKGDTRCAHRHLSCYFVCHVPCYCVSSAMWHVPNIKKGCITCPNDLEPTFEPLCKLFSWNSKGATIWILSCR